MIQELVELNVSYEKELEEIEAFKKIVELKISGAEIGEGYAVPLDRKYNIYIRVDKHDLKLREIPLNKIDRVDTAICYET